jgi:hypothetical protein
VDNGDDAYRYERLTLRIPESHSTLWYCGSRIHLTDEGTDMVFYLANAADKTPVCLFQNLPRCWAQKANYVACRLPSRLTVTAPTNSGSSWRTDDETPPCVIVTLGMGGHPNASALRVSGSLKTAEYFSLHFPPRNVLLLVSIEIPVSVRPCPIASFPPLSTQMHHRQNVH